jgi:hypothetical protein
MPKTHSQKLWLERKGEEGAFFVHESCFCDYRKQVGVVWKRAEW